MALRPDIDLSRCSACLSCVELCPDVFCANPAGYVEVLELEAYPAECIDQAAAVCPEDCLTWVKG